MSHERSLVNRRLVNLLSSGKMYLDQSVQHVQNIYGAESTNFNLVKMEISSQYDQSLGYRTMEALRNYVQHRGLPVHSITFSGKWIGDEDDAQLLHRIIPKINISQLEDDDKFKKTVLKELMDTFKAEKIDIRPLIREYVEGIGKIHEKIRELIQPDLSRWEIALDKTIAKFKDTFGIDASKATIVIVIENDNRHWEEIKSIFKEYIERRQNLEKKNRVFANFHKRYASNEIRKNDN
jgi:hypothetical protein